VRIKGIVRARDERGVETWVAIHRVGLRVSSEGLAEDLAGFSGKVGRIVALVPISIARSLANASPWRCKRAMLVKQT